MDQEALQRLLKDLQELDAPEAAEPPAPQSTAEPPAAEAPEEGEEVASETPDDSHSELERLLGSLRAVPAAAPEGPSYPSHDYEAAYASIAPSKPAEPEKPDIRKYTFAQALPVLSQLAADPDFIDQLQEIKSQQDTLELHILDERNKAKADLEKQLQEAQEAAKESGITYEVDRVMKLLNSANTKFDKQALVKWDALVLDQQAKLEQLGVPCFYVLKTPDPVASERQRRVMEMLTALLSDS